MQIDRDSVHFRILQRLCAMPRHVRGISSAMLERHFAADDAVEELAAAGLITSRGWANGPGRVWVPTAAGERLVRSLGADGQGAPAFQPVKGPAGSVPRRRTPPDRH